MKKYLINETDAGSDFAGFPNTNIRLEAAQYEEQGSYTQFVDDAGQELFSIKTDKVKTIRVE